MSGGFGVFGPVPNTGIPHIVSTATGDVSNRRRIGSAIRQYLKLEPRLTFQQVPYHPEFPSSSDQHTVELAQFLKLVLTEAAEVNFDEDFQTRGIWRDEKNIMMPKPNGVEEEIAVQVTKMHANNNGNRWLVRRSTHSELDVGFGELEEVLRVNHTRNEMMYTPEIYDANELLAWDQRTLKQATSTFGKDLAANSVRMQSEPHVFAKLSRALGNVFQLFYDASGPINGLGRMQDRVYHVLVLSARVRYNAEDCQSRDQPFIVQLPIDIASFSHVTSMTRKSHVQENRYHFAANDQTEALQPNDVQRNKRGTRLIEGTYVSMERISRLDNGLLGKSQWDKMLRADDGGSSRFHLVGTRSFLTRLMGADDVYHVIRYIAQTRTAEQNRARAAAKNVSSILDGTIGC